MTSNSKSLHIGRCEILSGHFSMNSHYTPRTASLNFDFLEETIGGCPKKMTAFISSNFGMKCLSSRPHLLQLWSAVIHAKRKQ